LQAVCCSDKEHCCPSGYTCDVSAGTCTQHSHSVSWNAVAVSHWDRPSSDDVVCPGGKAECPDGDTCCQMTSGQYGCCPFPKVRHFVYFVRETFLVRWCSVALWNYNYLCRVGWLLLLSTWFMARGVNDHCDVYTCLQGNGFSRSGRWH